MSHLLRQAWRRERFLKWKRGKGRIPRECQDEEWQEERVDQARYLFQEQDGAGRIVMLGATASPTMVGKTEEETRCIWPGCREDGCFDHIMWCCEKRRRKLPRPEEGLTRRLGWPRKGEDMKESRERVKWMAEVVEEIWKGRHGEKKWKGREAKERKEEGAEESEEGSEEEEEISSEDHEER